MTEESKGLTIYLSLTSSPSTPRAEVSIPNDATAAKLRQLASEATSVPLDKLKLIFRGRVITNKDDGDVIGEYKLEEGCVVHVMGKPVDNGGGALGGVAASSSSSTVPPTTAGASVTLPNNMNGMNIANNSAAASDSPLGAALAKLRSSNDGNTYRTAITTADKLLGNIISHPMEEKYRTIKKSNPAFSKRLGSVTGGSDLLLASGFTVETRDDTEYYVLTPSADAWPTLVKAREEVGKVLSEIGSAVPTPAAATGAANNTAGVGGSMPPMGGAGGLPPLGSAGMPDMNAMQNMLSDPNMMQNVMGMMNNPMVQNMMRNDPRFANNPMLQQSLSALQSNPEIMNQFSSMMADPNARSRMSSMMQQSGMGGMGGAATGAGGGGGDPFAAGPEAMRRQMEQFQQMAQQNGGSGGGFNTGGTGGGGGASGTGNNNNNASGATNDGEMTEEEMIAEAIARSLRES